MKRPAFQFYTGDWFSDAKLRRAGFYLKGVWMDVLCLLHDGEEYGILRWTLDEISRTVGCKKKDLQKLIEYGILKGSEKEGEKVSFSISVSQKNAPNREEILIKNQEIPLYFSSRMVRDEYIRKERGKHGGKSQNNPNVPMHSEKEKVGEKDTFSIIDKDTFSMGEKGSFSPSPSSSSSSSPNAIQKDLARKPKKLSGEYTPDFRMFWASYPRKTAKGDAFKAWLSSNPPLEECLESLKWQKLSEDWTKDSGKFIPYPASWIRSARWEDEPATPLKKERGFVC